MGAGAITSTVKMLSTGTCVIPASLNTASAELEDKAIKYYELWPMALSCAAKLGKTSVYICVVRNNIKRKPFI